MDAVKKGGSKSLVSLRYTRVWNDGGFVLELQFDDNRKLGMNASLRGR